MEISVTELRDYKRAAEAAGLSMSSWARSILREAVPRKDA
jgi:hypothetical protein